MATRIEKLARPKPNHLRHPARRSVYWLDHLPPERSESITRAELTPRWSELSRSKKIYAQETLSPVWGVSVWALQAVASDRLCALARPRAPVADWRPDRPLLAPLNRSTQTAVASSRLLQLSQPRRRKLIQESLDLKPKPEPLSEIPFRASAHTELLATPKPDHGGSSGERAACWSVSRAARNHVASRRLVELSGPKERRPLFEGYDPYSVSHAARSASSSPRIQQLALPLPRKCSFKKET